MKYLELPDVTQPASNIILGLMRIADKSDEEIRALYGAARENGINFIDHANVYGRNNLCERRWAEAVQPSSSEREEIIIQTKAGIVPGDITYFDFSYDTLVTEAEKSLERSEEHTSELQSRGHLVCRLLLEKKKKTTSH